MKRISRKKIEQLKAVAKVTKDYLVCEKNLPIATEDGIGLVMSKFYKEYKVYNNGYRFEFTLRHTPDDAKYTHAHGCVNDYCLGECGPESLCCQLAACTDLAAFYVMLAEFTRRNELEGE